LRINSVSVIIAYYYHFCQYKKTVGIQRMYLQLKFQHQLRSFRRVSHETAIRSFVDNYQEREIKNGLVLWALCWRKTFPLKSCLAMYANYGNYVRSYVKL